MSLNANSYFYVRDVLASPVSNLLPSYSPSSQRSISQSGKHFPHFQDLNPPKVNIADLACRHETAAHLL